MAVRGWALVARRVHRKSAELTGRPSLGDDREGMQDEGPCLLSRDDEANCEVLRLWNGRLLDLLLVAVLEGVHRKHDAVCVLRISKADRPHPPLRLYRRAQRHLRVSLRGGGRDGILGIDEDQDLSHLLRKDRDLLLLQLVAESRSLRA